MLIDVQCALRLFDDLEDKDNPDKCFNIDYLISDYYLTPNQYRNFHDNHVELIERVCGVQCHFIVEDYEVIPDGES